MQITCDNCAKSFNLDETLISKEGRFLQCGSCNHKWFHKKDILEKPVLSLENEKILSQIKDNNKPVVFISGHFNNFELMAMQIEKSGINLAAIYRPLNNIFLNKIMENIRINYICKNQIKKGRSGTRQILENLKKGNSIALMIDQRVTQGIKINFFGIITLTEETIIF